MNADDVHGRCTGAPDFESTANRQVDVFARCTNKAVSKVAICTRVNLFDELCFWIKHSTREQILKQITMARVLRLLVLAALIGMLLVGSVDSKKKKKRRGAGRGGNEKDRGAEDIFAGGMYKAMQRVREKTARREDQRRFVREAQKALQEFEKNSGPFAPELGPTYEITPAQREQFHRDGYVVLRGVFTPDEISFYREAVLHTMNLDVHYLTKRPGFLRVYNLWDKNDLVKKFVLSERLGRIGADLLGSDGVRLYQDQTFYKFPGDGDSPLHQDNYAAPLDTNQVGRVVAACLPHA